MTTKEVMESLIEALDQKGIDTKTEVFVHTPDGKYYEISNLCSGVKHEGVVICAVE